MTEANAAAESKLRTAFAAARPQKQLAAAEAFITTLRDLSETGATPCADTLDAGRKLLSNLEDQAEVYLFQAAVLAGRESGSIGEMERKVQSIGREAETVEKTARQLRRVLQV